MITRWAETWVREAREDTPAVLVHGPRQVGKSTLVKKLAAESGMSYLTLDDLVPLELAQRNPEAFLRTHPAPLVIDEIQRAPGLLLALKSMIDRERRPGAYLLTGSANVLALPKVADSLAGRMEIVQLDPLTQAEIEGVGPDWVDRAFAGDMPSVGAGDWEERAERGGFPEPQARTLAKRREAWFAAYVRSLLERDVRDLAQIQGLTQMPRLLRAIAGRTGETLNISAFARETNLPPTTLERYFDLLRAVFLVRTLPPWAVEPAQAHIKAPKVYTVDSGLLLHLLGGMGDERRRALVLANFVFSQLQAADQGLTLGHLRTVRQREVDFVLERPDGQVIGIHVIPEPAVTPAQIEGLRYLRELAGDRFVRGIALYEGAEHLRLEEGLEAWPLRTLWGS